MMAPLKTTRIIEQPEFKEFIPGNSVQQPERSRAQSGKCKWLEITPKADYLAFVWYAYAISYSTVSLHGCACKPSKTKVSKCNGLTPSQGISATQTPELQVSK